VSGLLEDIVLTITLIGIPTCAMGASLPLLTEALGQGFSDGARFHSRLYVVNTFGAVCGALVTGFFLIPAVGLERGMAVAAGLTVLASVGLLLLGGTTRLPMETQQRSHPAALPTGEVDRASALVLPCLIAGLSGAVSLTLQGILLRLVALSVGSATYVFPVVVAGFVAAMAAGAWVACDRPSGPWQLRWVQLGAIAGLLSFHLLVPDLGYYGHVLRVVWSATVPGFYLFWAAVTVGVFLVMLVPVGALGAALPILVADSRSRLGERVGWIYGSNALGCIIGALGGGYIAFSWLNLGPLFSIVTIAACAGLFLIASGMGGVMRALWQSISVACFALAMLMPEWPLDRFAHGRFSMQAPTTSSFGGPTQFFEVTRPGGEIIAYKDDPNTTVAVGNYPNNRSILVNGKSDGSTSGGDRVTTKLVAHLPILLAEPVTRRAAVIGFGTGITVGTLARYDSLSRIDVFEISSAVREFSPLFSKYNDGAAESSKLVWQMGDAYRRLLETPGQFDVIASEPTNPWVSGVERLYSTEFLTVARSKLAPGGVFAQWFHSYSISPERLDLVVETFRDVFPEVHLFARGTDLILLGSAHTLKPEQLLTRFRATWVDSDLRSIGFPSRESLLTAEVPYGRFYFGPLHSNRHPRLSFGAALDRFMGANSDPVEISERLERRAASRAAFRATLAGVWMGLGIEAPKVSLNKLRGIFCPSAVNSSTFSRTPIACQGALVGLSVLGEEPVSGLIQPGVLQLLRRAVGSSAESGGLLLGGDVQTASAAFGWLIQYGAPFIDISPEKMELMAGPCVASKGDASTACRLRYVTALAVSNHRAEALDRLALLRFEQASKNLPAALLQQAELAIGSRAP
jgi:spermidine synthase